MRAHLGRSDDPLFLYYTDYFRYHLYNVDLQVLPALLLKNSSTLLQSIGELLVTPPVFLSMTTAGGVALFRLVMQSLGIMAIAGCVRDVRVRGLTPYYLFAGMYASLLVVWHYPPDSRFLFPLMPILLAGCWHEARALGRFFRNRPRVMLAIPAGIAAAVLVWMGIGWFHLVRFMDNIREIARLNAGVYTWIARHTPPDAKFLAYDDVVLHLYTGRTAYRPVVPTRYLYREDEAGVERFVGSLPALARRHHLTYILAGPRDWHGEILPLGLATRTHAMLAAAGLPVAFQSGSLTLFRVAEESAVAGTPSPPPDGRPQPASP